MIKEIIENGNKPHKSSGKFSISGIGSCWREKYLSLWKEYRKTFDQKTIRIFSLGDFIHRQCVGNLMTNSPAYGYEVIAAEINIPEHQYMSGRIDCILSQLSTGKKIVIDFKSAGSWTFDKVKNSDVPQNYIDQLNLYMHLLGIPHGVLLFMNKNNSEVHEHEVVYDYARAQKNIEDVKYFFENYVYKGELPPKCDGGMFGCEVCSNDEMVNEMQQHIKDYLLGGSYEDLYKEDNCNGK